MAKPRDPGGSLSGGDPYLRREAVVEVGIIFKIGAVGILVSVLSLVLKHSGREDQAFLTSLAGLVLVLFWVLPYIYDLFETVKNYLLCRMYSRSFSALTFAADFPPVAPEFHQRTHRVRLRNLGTTDKKTSHKIKHRKIPRVH